MLNIAGGRPGTVAGWLGLEIEQSRAAPGQAWLMIGTAAGRAELEVTTEVCIFRTAKRGNGSRKDTKASLAEPGLKLSRNRGGGQGRAGCETTRDAV